MGRSKNTMDPIKLPDKERINNLSGGYVNSRRVYKESSIDDFTNTVRANFDNAAPVKVPERTAEEDEKDELDEYLEEKKNREEKFNRHKTKGVKVGKKFVGRWLIKRIAIISVVVLFVLITFFPPIMFSTDQGNTLSVNVFQSASISKLKEEVLSDWNVYNIDNMSSEKANNYRVCTVGIDIKNLSPYKLEIDGFKVVTCDPTYSDKIVAARIPGGKAELSPFKVDEVTVEILVNVSELTEEQFNEAMTSLVLRSTGMRKKIGPIPIPTIPAFIFVSNVLEFHMNPNT